MSPIAAKELKGRWSFEDKSDLIIALVCSHLLFAAIGYGVSEAQQRTRAEAIAALQKPTTNTLPKTDWSTFDCKELRAICWNRAKQRVTEYVR